MIKHIEHGGMHIMPLGKCPACDAYFHEANIPKPEQKPEPQAAAEREGECQYCGNELKNRKTSCFDCLEEENQRLTAENLRYKAALEYIEQRAWAIEPKENAWKRVNDFCEVAREALRGSK